MGVLLRLVLLACCITLLPGQAEDVSAVVALLAALTSSALNGYLQAKPVLGVTLGLYILACMLWPPFGLFVPLVCYDALVMFQATDRPGWLLAVIGAFGVTVVNLPVATGLSVGALLGVSYLLAYYTVALEKNDKMARTLRDNAHELTMLLQRQNQELLAKQDYEIRLATLNERSRIAREIHDHVGHLLSRCLLQVGALLVTKPHGPHQESLTMIKDTLAQAMEQIRKSVHDLHAESFELRTQVEALVQEFTFCPIRLDYRLEREPSKDIAYCFLAVIKEGLNNIMRHSGATQATLMLLEHPALYQLILQDNGAGARPDTGQGLGLKSMLERVQTLQGQMTIDQEGGFRIFISIPKGGKTREGSHHR